MIKKLLSLFLISFFSSNIALADISNSTVSAQISDSSGNSISSSAGSLLTNVTNTVPVSQSGVWTVGISGSISGTVTANQGTTPWVNNISQFGGSNVVTGTGVSGAGIPRVTVSSDSNILATQSGGWTTGRTWALLNSTDSVNAVQSGTWNLNNISGTVSLPTGASTAANQTSVIGSASGGTSAVSSLLMGGVFNTALPTLTNGQQSSFQFDSSGRLVISPLTTSSTTVANQGTPNIISNAWPIEITDGTNQVTVKALNNQVVGTDYGLVTNSAIHGLTTAGGGGYVDVKVNPSGALEVAVGDISGVTGQALMANSLPVAIASNQSAIPVSQSGTWDLNNISGTITLPTGASSASNQTNGNQKTQVVDGSGNVVGPVQTISGTNYQPVVLAASATSGSALVPRSIQIAGSDGVNAQTISTNSSGQVNVNNISGTVSLPTGAATAANQTSVIGTVGAGTAAASSVLTGGVYNSALPVLTTGQQAAIQLDSSGRAIIAPLTTSSNINVTQSTSPWVNNISQFGGSNVVTGTGASGSGIPRVTVSNDSNVGLNAGTNAIGYNTGRAVLSTFTQNYGSVNLTTGAFVTIISSTSSTVNEIDIFDNSGGVFYLAYAATCGALSNSSNAIIVNPGGGIKDFAIPSGNCVGFEALGSNITSGNVYMTFYK